MPHALLTIHANIQNSIIGITTPFEPRVCSALVGAGGRDLFGDLLQLTSAVDTLTTSISTALRLSQIQRPPTI